MSNEVKTLGAAEADEVIERLGFDPMNVTANSVRLYEGITPHYRFELRVDAALINGTCACGKPVAIKKTQECKTCYNRRLQQKSRAA